MHGKKLSKLKLFSLIIVLLTFRNYGFANENSRFQNELDFGDFNSFDYTQAEQESNSSFDNFGLEYSAQESKGAKLLQHKIIYDPIDFINEPLYYGNYHLFSSAEVLISPAYIFFDDGKPSQNSFVYLSNTIKNLGAPVSAVNFLLMGKFKLAGLTSTAFLVNSTVGVLGIFNASDALFGISSKYNAQFGITTVYYTNFEGFYTFIPVLGPNHLSDLVGFGVDLFFDPFFYFVPWFSVSASLARRMESYFSSRAGVDLLISLSTSEYLGAQSLYYQKRRLMVDLLRKDEFINYYK